MWLTPNLLSGHSLASVYGNARSLGEAYVTKVFTLFPGVHKRLLCFEPTHRPKLT